MSVAHRLRGIKLVAWLLIVEGCLISLPFLAWLIGWVLNPPKQIFYEWLIPATARVIAGIYLRRLQFWAWCLAVYLFSSSLVIFAIDLPGNLRSWWALGYLTLGDLITRK